MTQPQHSSQFIDEMNKRLASEIMQIKQELSTIASKHGKDYQTTFPEYGRSEEDNATEMSDYQARASTEAAIEERLNNLQAAKKHISENTYGVTEQGALIPEARLRANPAATTIIEST